MSLLIDPNNPQAYVDPNEKKRAFIEEFRKRAIACGTQVYRLALTDPVDMEYRIVNAAMDAADEYIPPDEEGNRLPQWSQLKNSFIDIAEKTVEIKLERKDIL